MHQTLKPHSTSSLRNTDSNAQSYPHDIILPTVTVRGNTIPPLSPPYSPGDPPSAYTESTNIGEW